MTNKAVALVGPVIVLGIAAVFLFSKGEVKEEKHVAPVTSLAEVQPVSSPSSVQESPTQETNAPASPTPERVSLTPESSKMKTETSLRNPVEIFGRVEDSSRQSLSGVKVELFANRSHFGEAHETHETFEPEAALSTMTDNSGRYQFLDQEKKVSSTTEFVELRFSREGFANNRQILQIQKAGSQEVTTTTLYREARISGQLLAPIGQSLSGPQVIVLGGLGGRVSMEQANDSGYFDLRGMNPGKYRVQGRAKGMLSMAAAEVQLEEGQHLSGVQITLTLGLSIRGQVRSQDGKPVEGATVRLGRIFENLDEMREGMGVSFGNPDASAVSDREGLYVLSGLEPGDYEIRVRANGYSESLQSKVKAGSDRVDFILGSQGSIRGIVVDPDTGLGVSGCVVRVQKERKEGFGIEVGRRPKNVETKTNAAGEFHLTGVQPGMYTLNFEKDRFAPGSRTEVSVLASQETRLEAFRLSRGCELVVQVSAAASVSPLRGVLLRAETVVEKPSHARRRVVREGPGPFHAVQQDNRLLRYTDENGSARFENLNPGRYRILASHADWAPASVEFVVEQGKPNSGEISLSAGGSICGLVTRETGVPYVGATIELESAEGEKKEQSADGTGRYCFERLAAGQYYVRINETPSMDNFVIVRDGDEPEGVPAFVREGEKLDIPLQEQAKAILRGRILQAGAPAPKVSVRLNKDSGFSLPGFDFPGMKQGRSDESGFYEIKGILPGKYIVSAAKDGAPLPKETPFELRAGSNELDIPLPGGLIEGRVVDASSGKGIPGLRVSVEKESSAPRRGAMIMVSMETDSENGPGNIVTSDGSGNAVKTDAEGKFQLTGLPAGKFKIQVKGNAVYGDGSRSGVELAEDAKQSGIEVSLQPGGIVRGKVVDPSGASAGMRVLVLMNAQGEPVRTVPTGVDGSFRIEGLVPGQYELRTAGARDSVGNKLSVLVKPGETTDCELRVTE